ncbi:uncharacterized protein [Solanum tuberosum]|uniref:uncharacterized protein n=1 Tax=Solanum tuberosum TaxID=4113 RepID=UPI000739FA37|nr:PREDICTED: uncharacterized protein LOC107060527 [Solanum tuberosum]
MLSILEACLSSPVCAHHGGAHTTHKFFQSGYNRPTIHQVIFDLVKAFDTSQRHGAISRSHELHVTRILEVELLDVWDINFMGSFLSSYVQKHILVEVDYVYKWAETVALAEIDGKSVASYLKKNSFSKFDIPREIKSNGGSHFCTKVFSTLLAKYDPLCVEWLQEVMRVEELHHGMIVIVLKKKEINESS